MSGDSIGMMEGAFFVSKGVILEWLNELLDLQLSKIEQCATGSVYCQVMDAIYPGTFSMAKVKWGAKFDYEYVENYKVLQNAFAKNGIKKHIDVGKLVMAKYQDNLEMCQWIKRYFDLNYSGEPYNALQRRKGNDIFYIMGGNKVGPPQRKAAPAGGGVGKTYVGNPGGAGKSAGGGSSGYGPPGGGAKRSMGGAAGGGGGGGASFAELKQLEDQVAEFKMNNDTLDREREFYFGKLRDIEDMLQKKGMDQDPLGSDILKILSASEEEQVAVNEQGELHITQAGDAGGGGGDDGEYQ